LTGHKKFPFRVKTGISNLKVTILTPNPTLSASDQSEAPTNFAFVAKKQLRTEALRYQLFQDLLVTVSTISKTSTSLNMAYKGVLAILWPVVLVAIHPRKSSWMLPSVPRSARSARRDNDAGF
jgi:hypothetical protein